MRFFLGTHHSAWLGDSRFANVPLFISRRVLQKHTTLPRAVGCFALDSGGFTELQIHGRWSISAQEYAVEIRHFIQHFQDRLLWVAPQDWMCEPIVIAGGQGAGVWFKGTGLTVQEHQRRTVANFMELRRLIGSRVIPVVQGWELHEYAQCVELYARAGVDLQTEPTVGVGSVCRRQSTDESTAIMSMLASRGLRLHGFGFKQQGLKNCQTIMASADSMAWSAVARRRKICLPGHDRPGPGIPRGHKNCANCAEFALLWRTELLKNIEVQHD